jgi:hypothetical protein
MKHAEIAMARSIACVEHLVWAKHFDFGHCKYALFNQELAAVRTWNTFDNQDPQ